MVWKLLKNDIPVDVVSKITGLGEEEIDQLKVEN